MPAWCVPFETKLNFELDAVRYVSDRYKILSARPVDEEGKPYPKRITGFDLMPESEHDVITGLEVCKLWKLTPDEVVNSLTASEYLRRVAIVRASNWDQPTKAQIEQTKYKRRMGRM